jgi:hypothetical protein
MGWLIGSPPSAPERNSGFRLEVVLDVHYLSMPPFSSRPLNERPLHRLVNKYPAVFGVPFILLMVAASYGMTTFTQTRYDLQDQKVKQVWPVFPFSFLMFNLDCLGDERARAQAG